MEQLDIYSNISGCVFANWSKMSGHELVSSSEDAGVFTYLIRKGA